MRYPRSPLTCGTRSTASSHHKTPPGSHHRAWCTDYPPPDFHHPQPNYRRSTAYCIPHRRSCNPSPDIPPRMLQRSCCSQRTHISPTPVDSRRYSIQDSYSSPHSLARSAAHTAYNCKHSTDYPRHTPDLRSRHKACCTRCSRGCCCWIGKCRSGIRRSILARQAEG